MSDDVVFVQDDETAVVLSLLWLSVVKGLLSNAPVLLGDETWFSDDIILICDDVALFREDLLPSDVTMSSAGATNWWICWEDLKCICCCSCCRCFCCCCSCCSCCDCCCCCFDDPMFCDDWIFRPPLEPGFVTWWGVSPQTDFLCVYCCYWTWHCALISFDIMICM